MSTTEKYVLGGLATLMSAELNGLVNNSLAPASSPYANAIGGGGDGYTLCDLELVVSFGSAPAASSAVSVWLLAAPDGVNYEDGSATVTPTRSSIVFGVRSVSGAQRIVRRVRLPWGSFLPLVKNDGTGVAFASSGNLLRVRPVTAVGV